MTRKSMPVPERVRDVRCPQCNKDFQLIWKEWDRNMRDVTCTLLVRSCPSGGIYDVSISCPHCDYEEEL